MWRFAIVLSDQGQVTDADQGQVTDAGGTMALAPLG